MVPKLKELQSLPDSDLIAAHDNLAPSTQVGIGYYLEELARRDQNRQTESMLRCTYWIVAMTIIVTVATVANLVVAYLTLRRP